LVRTLRVPRIDNFLKHCVFVRWGVQIEVCPYRSIQFTTSQTQEGWVLAIRTKESKLALLGQTHIVTFQSGHATEAMSTQTHALARVLHTAPRQVRVQVIAAATNQHITIREPTHTPPHATLCASHRFMYTVPHCILAAILSKRSVSFVKTAAVKPYWDSFIN
jgi:hypothetical protein